MHQHDEAVGKERDEGDEYYQSINGKEEQLEGFGWKVVFLELWERDCVEENYPHDVDEKENSEDHIAERFQLLGNVFAGLLKPYSNWLQFFGHNVLPKAAFVWVGSVQRH